MEKRCLISYAKNGRENYEKALDRNRTEAIKYYGGDFLYAKDSLPPGCKPHSEVPYAFKPYLFAESIKQGYNQVLWLDSTICVNADLEPIFKVMKERGVVAFHNPGHELRKYISDKAIMNTGVNINDNPAQIMACVVGFDLEHPMGKKIFNEWMQLANDGSSFQENGSIRPEFIAHRHDQACLSALLHINDVKLLPYGNLVYEAHENGYDDKIAYFINRGI
jgi:hypothetical protein